MDNFFESVKRMGSAVHMQWISPTVTRLLETFTFTQFTSYTRRMRIVASAIVKCPCAHPPSLIRVFRVRVINLYNNNQRIGLGSVCMYVCVVKRFFLMKQSI